MLRPHEKNSVIESQSDEYRTFDATFTASHVIVGTTQVGTIYSGAAHGSDWIAVGRVDNVRRDRAQDQMHHTHSAWKINNSDSVHELIIECSSLAEFALTKTANPDLSNSIQLLTTSRDDHGEFWKFECKLDVCALQKTTSSYSFNRCSTKSASQMR